MAIQLEYHTIELYKENVKFEQLALPGEAEGSFAGCCRERRKGVPGREAKHGALQIAAHSGTRSSSVCWGVGWQWQETTQEVEAVKQTDISSKTHDAPGNGKPWGFRQGSNMTRSLRVRRISWAAVKSVHRQVRDQKWGAQLGSRSHNPGKQ